MITKPFFIDDPDDFLLKLSSFLEIDEEDKKVFLSQFKKAKTLNKELTLKQSISDEDKAKFLVRSHMFENAYVGKGIYVIIYILRSSRTQLVMLEDQMMMSSMRFMKKSLNNKINFTYTNQLIIGKTGLRIHL